ncbi:Calx-beta domain-containing protein [Goodfellowiella coeruleoviolacea]|uniref:von Willebrand factor type A domain-containing protein n=1 Tax=Goodfellowiella coeruleoviolacea TaxID=334858 RepID=A0AAE3GL32_9PSEU|nr:Calx-beta domain-containing protein [Goodfellowiella coeruleoviolacea]MCP2170035.1 von Willebrand factor type A domain-containing protein [Goodfellowiella coeruleoviolacea]
MSVRSTSAPTRLRRAGVAALAALATWATTAVALAAPPAAAQVDPSDVEVTLGPGASATVAKTVTTPSVPPNPDLVFLADTTGSMGGAIANVRANAASVTSAVLSAQPSAQFAVAEYRDATDPFVFRVNQNLTGDTAAVQTGIDAWVASGGGDFPEAAVNALFEIGSGAVAFRPDGTRILAWFGDAPSHDPSQGHTLADAVAALQAAGIRVVAVNMGAAGSGLDTGGQATSIVTATGGVLLNNVPADQVAQAILDGIQAVKVTVTPTITACDPQLSVVLTPASQTVNSGDKASFTETITVQQGAAAGTYHCTVDFLVDGASRGFVERTTVHVPGVRVNDVTVAEGDAGSTPAAFTVSLDRPSPGPVTVDFTTADGTAGAPGDYTPASGTVTIAPGATSAVVTVPVTGDTTDELDETFTVALTAASGAAITDPTGVGTIVDDDRDGVFSCRASALNLVGVEPVVANPSDVPCVPDSKTVARVGLNAGALAVNAKALTATTVQTPGELTSAPPAEGDNATATASVDTTTISTLGLTIELGVIRSTASARCVPGEGGLVPRFSGDSTVASLKINGVPTEIGSGPVTIPLVIGSLTLNSTETTATSVVQRAVALDTVLADVVIGEARADVHGSTAHPHGNPCRG